MRQIVTEQSSEADLTILGFRAEQVKKKGTATFIGFEGMGNILFVNALKEKEITML